jgi:hypothetical protein
VFKAKLVPVLFYSTSSTSTGPEKLITKFLDFEILFLQDTNQKRNGVNEVYRAHNGVIGENCTCSVVQGCHFTFAVAFAVASFTVFNDLTTATFACTL